MDKTLYIKTFGCQMNERDSAIMEQILAKDGYIPCPDPELADTIILNTCSIRGKAEQKVYSLLGQLRALKERNPSLCIVVAGCVAQQDGERIFQRMDHVDIVVGTQQLYRLADLVDRVRRCPGKKELATAMDDQFSIPPYATFRGRRPPSPSIGRVFRRFVTIMQGCNNFCSYCVVPTTRGRETSRSVADILDEVTILVQEEGVKEVTLLGQNVNSYGQTNPVADRTTTFADLLRMVAAVEGLERLRFTTSNPKDLSDDLMRCFAELENLCPHIHLPVQSGSNRVLARMNRKYSVETYLDKVARLRTYQPDIALSTDFIVGFPGETEEDFSATIRLMESVRFHSSFSFKYSDRPNTRSAAFGDKIDEAVKSRRLQELQTLQDEISLERNNEYLGKKIDVLVESSNTDCFQGRTGTNHIVHVTSRCQPAPGDTVKVAITHAGNHSLQGVLDENNDERLITS